MEQPSEQAFEGPPIEAMSTNEFEHFVASLFRRRGYGVQVTPQSGDYGADLVVASEIARAVVQVKHYSGGNFVGVQDITHLHGSKQYYQCDSAIVITTTSFTRQAQEMAGKLGVQLWDGDRLRLFIQDVGYKSVSRIPTTVLNEWRLTWDEHAPGRVSLSESDAVDAAVSLGFTRLQAEQALASAREEYLGSDTAKLVRLLLARLR